MEQLRDLSPSDSHKESQSTERPRNRSRNMRPTMQLWVRCPASGSTTHTADVGCNKDKISMDDLKDKLLKSESLKSLRGEVDISNALAVLGWQVVTGSVYSDPKTSKLREVDSCARRMWRKSSPPHFVANVVIYCESKSMSGFHLVFPPATPPTFNRLLTACHHVWFGSPYPSRRGLLEDIFAGAGVAPNSIHRIIDGLVSISHPNGSALIADMMIDPPQASTHATTFKETNIGGEKDADNSVLWRACSSLSSVLNAASSRLDQSCCEDLSLIGRNGIQHNTFIHDIHAAYLKSVGYVTLYHPIVVVDAQMWELNASDLKPIESCRLIQHSATSLDMTWYDVVHRDAFKPYVTTLTEHYASSFGTINCEIMDTTI